MNIIDNHNLLSTQQKNLLQNNGVQSFVIGKFHSLDDILTSLQVDVIIEPGIINRSIPAALNDAEKFWREKANRLDSLIRDAEDREAVMKDCSEASNKAEDIRKEKEAWATMTLRGLYEPDANVIKLYPEEMKQEYSGSRMDELLVSTLAHETMHAYFNRPRHKNFPYVVHVEEPLAEFGMLLYLNETGSSYYNWAHQDVSNKKTCYRYGAMLMNQHLNGDKKFRKQLENYKIKLNDYPMPTVDPIGGSISMPTKGVATHSTVQVGGVTIHPKWHDVFKYPPRYFYDKKTNTLGLDGDWNDGHMHRRMHRDVSIVIKIDQSVHSSNPLNHVYLGDHFTTGYNRYLRHLLSLYNVVVSPVNKEFYAKQGVPFLKKDDKPFLSLCGDGLYAISRNGKWGVIDEQLNQVVPCKYDSVFSFDKNGLVKVEDSNHYGLVNKQGKEQVPVIYDIIGKNFDGTYTVKQNGSEFKIDKNGNKI